jgi:hypothetical protein
MCGRDENLWLNVVVCWRIMMARTRCKTIYICCLLWDINIKVPRRFVNSELYKHVYKKSERNQNENGNNRKSLWQGEWNHFLTLVQDRALFWATIVVACTVNTLHQSVWVGLTMTTFLRVKLSLVITISTCFRATQDKMRNLSLYMSSNDIFKAMSGSPTFISRFLHCLHTWC